MKSYNKQILLRIQYLAGLAKNDVGFDFFIVQISLNINLC